MRVTKPSRIWVTIGIPLVLALLVAGIQPARPVAAVTGVVAYHGVSSATHSSKTGTLTATGYRPISLSVYGTATSPVYAAVWVKRTGPAFRMFYANTHTVYQTTLTSWTAEGYRPEILTAMGSGSSARIAAVFVKDSTFATAVHGVSKTTFDDKNKLAFDNGYVLRSAALYGTSAAPLYAAVWVKQKLAWAVHSFDPSSHFGPSVTGFAQAGLRPKVISGQVGGRYLALWLDDRIGGWYAYHNLTPTDYQATFNSMNTSGYYPIYVSGFGSGSSIRYSVAFAKRDTALARAWTTTGTASASLAGFDTYVKSLMTKVDARAGSLAIVRNGSLVLARGYTWAESGYVATQPTSLFRIASCSKPITSITLHSMEEDTVLDVDHTFQSSLKLTRPTLNLPPLDPDFDDITLKQLLYHRGGWDRDLTKFDPMFADTTVNTVFAGTLPVTRREIGRYMAASPLDFDPGAKGAYSNFGYSLLGQVMETKGGKSYQQLVTDRVLSPLGLTRPRIGSSDYAARLSGEVRYESTRPSVAPSVLSATQPLVAGQYGSWNLRNMDANGAWVMAAPDFAKILGAFDRSPNPLLGTTAVTDMTTPWTGTGTLRGWFLWQVKDAAGTTRNMWVHSGSLDGTSCIVTHRVDGVSIVLLLNRNISDTQDRTNITELNNLVNKVTTWPTTDLFPSVGIPKF